MAEVKMQKAIFRLEPLGERLVDAWHDLGYKADYDEFTDVFRFAPIDEMGKPDPNLADEEDAEHFPAMMSTGIKLYPVGAGSWVWEEVQAS